LLTTPHAHDVARLCERQQREDMNRDTDVEVSSNCKGFLCLGDIIRILLSGDPSLLTGTFESIPQQFTDSVSPSLQGQ